MPPIRPPLKGIESPVPNPKPRERVFFKSENAPIEKTVEEQLLLFLRQKQEIANAGNKGVIFRFGSNEITEQLRSDLKKQGVELESDVAVKALKIFRPGDAKREYEMMSRAAAIVNSAENKEKLARVPRVLAFKNLELDDELRSNLNRQGANLDKKVGVILMDYVDDAPDLATILYRKVLESLNFDISLVESMPFPELHQLVSSQLGFSRPGGKQANTGIKYFEETIVQSDNSQKLLNFLRTRGFTLDPSILDKIKRTSALFHANGLFHNDLHERNVLIQNSGGKNEVFIIDFGSATEKIVQPEEAGFKVSDDLDTVRRLQILTISIEQEEKQELEKEFVELYKLSLSLGRKPEWVKRLSQFKTAFLKNNSALENYLIFGSSSETGINEFLVFLIKLSQDNNDFKSVIIEFLDNKLKENKKSQPFVIRRLKLLKKYLER